MGCLLTLPAHSCVTAALQGCKDSLPLSLTQTTAGWGWGQASGLQVHFLPLGPPEVSRGSPPPPHTHPYWSLRPGEKAQKCPEGQNSRERSS